MHNGEKVTEFTSLCCIAPLSDTKVLTNKRKLMPDKQAQRNLISKILLFYNESYEIK